MPISWIKKLWILLAASFVLAGCSSGDPEPQPPQAPYQYQIPQYIDDGWQTGHLADFGFDTEQLVDLIQDIQKGTHPGIDSISIVRDNTLLLHHDFQRDLTVYDSWINNSDPTRHVMHSTSKSFVSALAGIAVQQGYIQDTSRPFYSFFDYSEYENWDDRKNSITFENALTMQLGLEWDEWTYAFGDNRNSLTSLTNNSDDYIKSMLDLPIVTDPGTDYAYNTIASIAIGAAVENATGIPLEDYAEQYLFEPLQIADAQWLMTPTGLPNTGSGLFLATRDMAKFGQLYLDGGVWNGLRLLEESWVADSLARSVELSWDYTSGYGYQWWLGEFVSGANVHPFYSTRGFGGQFIILILDFNLVIAFTAHNYNDDLYDSPFRLTEQFIIPAITQL